MFKKGWWLFSIEIVSTLVLPMYVFSLGKYSINPRGFGSWAEIISIFLIILTVLTIFDIIGTFKKQTSASRKTKEFLYYSEYEVIVRARLYCCILLIPAVACVFYLWVMTLLLSKEDAAEYSSMFIILSLVSISFMVFRIAVRLRYVR